MLKMSKKKREMSASVEDSRDSLEDCTCPICISILIYPVTMPCHHELCMPCFKHNVEESSLLCPLCRLRISSWTRHASRTKTLVNESRWKQIRDLFPDRVQRRLDGVDEDSNEETFHHPPVHIAAPGEIRKEYEEELHKLRLQRLEERQKEAEESIKLIEKLAREEKEAFHQRQLQLERTAQLDEVLAQELNEEINEAGADTPVVRERGIGSASSASTASSRSNSSSLTTFFKSKPLRGKDSYPYTCLTPIDKNKEADGRNSKSSEEILFKYSIGATKASDIENSDHPYCRTPCTNKPSALGRPPSVDSITDATIGRPSPDAAVGGPLSTNATISRPLSTNTTISRPLSTNASLSRPFSTNVPIGRPSYPDATINTDAAFGRPSSSDSVTGRPSSQDAVICRPSSRDAVICRPSSRDAVICRPSSVVISPCDKLVENERSDSVASSDSITNELCHFKPISSCPRTPPRKLANGVSVDPPVVRTTPRNLSRNGFSPLDQSSPSLNPGSPLMQRRLFELAEERKQFVKERSKSTSTAATSQIEVTHPFVSDHSSRDEHEDSLIRSPLHKHLDTNSDTLPPTLAYKTNLLIPMESIIEDTDFMEIPSPVFHRKMESEDKKNVSHGKENVIHPCSSGITPHSSKTTVHKSVKTPINKSKLTKDKHKSVQHAFTSPQRSIKDWLKLIKDSDGLSPDSSDSPPSLVHLSNTRETSPFSRCSQSDSSLDSNSNRNIRRKNPIKPIHSFVDIAQISDDSDFESDLSMKQVSRFSKEDCVFEDELCSSVLKNEKRFVDHSYHKDISTNDCTMCIDSSVCPHVTKKNSSNKTKISHKSKATQDTDVETIEELQSVHHCVTKKNNNNKIKISHKSLTTEDADDETKEELQSVSNIREKSPKHKAKRKAMSNGGQLIKTKNKILVFCDENIQSDILGSSDESPKKQSSPKKTKQAKTNKNLDNLSNDSLIHYNSEKFNKDVMHWSCSSTETSERKRGRPPKNKSIDAPMACDGESNNGGYKSSETDTNTRLSRRNRRINSVVKNMEDECQTPKKRKKGLSWHVDENKLQNNSGPSTPNKRGLRQTHLGKKDGKINVRSSSLNELPDCLSRLRKSPKKRFKLMEHSDSEEEDEIVEKESKNSNQTSAVSDGGKNGGKNGSKDGIRGQSRIQNVVCDRLEDHDRLVAEKLQKQFDLELKLNLVEGRFKGTDRQYLFRRKPKYS